MDDDRTLLFWARIRWPDEQVCIYNSRITGIEKGDLDYGTPFDIVKSSLKFLVGECNIIGHNSRSDYKALDLVYPIRSCEDLQDFYS